MIVFDPLKMTGVWQKYSLLMILLVIAWSEAKGICWWWWFSWWLLEVRPRIFVDDDDFLGDCFKWGQGGNVCSQTWDDCASNPFGSNPLWNCISHNISAKCKRYFKHTVSTPGNRKKRENVFKSIEAFKESPVPQNWTNCCFSFDLMTFFRSLCSNRRPKSEGGQSWSTSKLFSGFLIHYLLSFQIRGSYLFHSRSYTSLWTSLSSPPFHHSSETREQVEEQLVCCQVLLLWVPQLGQCDWSGTRFFLQINCFVCWALEKFLTPYRQYTFQIYFVDFFLGGEFTTYGSDVGIIITKIIITITTFLIITSSWYQQCIVIS